jgi:formylglycine-generating enzyme required for sulfatase activity
MKKFFTLFIAIFLLSSFGKKRNKTFIPPGTVQINETFYADETEISNASWNEFERWTIIKHGYHSEEHKSVLPDTNVWLEKASYNQPYVDYYYRHPAYKEYPVVGVSYDQAVKFCKWRTERVKEFCYLGKKKAPEIEYRLPTKEEWELISDNGFGVFDYKNARNEKGLFVLNCVREFDLPSDTLYKGLHKYPDVTAPVYSYWKNRFGLWNSFGNVAEMISEKGVSKGGGWRHHFEECRAGKDLTYTKPSAWLGFRCVCVVKNSKV